MRGAFVAFIVVFGKEITTGHFSDYSIVYDDTMRNDTLPEGFTRNTDSTKGTELYRLYNPYDYQHLWTTNKGEYDYLGSIGWNKEGVAFKVQ